MFADESAVSSTKDSKGALLPLRIAAAVELCSLLVLFANLATVHWPGVSALIGPTHGCAYLIVIALAVRYPAATTAMKALAVVPGIGGLLVLRRAATGRTPPGAG